MLLHRCCAAVRVSTRCVCSDLLCGYPPNVCAAASNMLCGQLPDVCAASDLLCLAGPQVRSHFRPEFINRIDEFTVFRSLQRSDIKRIVILQAKRVEERLQAKKMKMKLLEPAIEFLAVSVVSH